MAAPEVFGGPVGVWTFAFDRLPAAEVRSKAAAIERLGYTSIWVGEAGGREAFTHAGLLLDATQRIVVANGIARIGERSARVTAAAQRGLAESHSGRYLLGLGGSNQLGTGVDAIAAMAGYLDDLDACQLGSPAPAVPPRRVLGAYSPALQRLARDRADGSHTYLVPPEHTVLSRSIIGPDRLLAVEQAVMLATDASTARAAARAHVGFFLQVPTYRHNFVRSGFDEADLGGGGSDRLLDGLVAWGTAAQVAERVRAHLDAGADHVCIQPIDPTGSVADLECLAALASELNLTPTITPTLENPHDRAP